MPIKGFGGVSQGGEILKELHGEIERVLEPLVGKPVTVTAIVDIMNLIGKCVVAGNVRRTAEIAFGDPESSEYIDLKGKTKGPSACLSIVHWIGRSRGVACLHRPTRMDAQQRKQTTR